MERAKYFIITLSILVLQIPDAMSGNKEVIYKSFINDRMDNWKTIIDDMETNKNMASSYILELVNFQYGYIAWCMGNDRKKEARDYLGLAEGNLDILEERAYKLSHVNFYKSAFYGFKIGLNVLKAPFLGPKSLNYAELALEQDPENPFAQIIFGSAHYFMPESLGGSKTLAIEHYLNAEKLMERDHEAIRNDWNYINLLAAIGQAYEDTGNNNMALKYYRKALDFEPDFSWVKNELYPNLLKKVN